MEQVEEEGNPVELISERDFSSKEDIIEDDSEGFQFAEEVPSASDEIYELPDSWARRIFRSRGIEMEKDRGWWAFEKFGETGMAAALALVAGLPKAGVGITALGTGASVLGYRGYQTYKHALSLHQNSEMSTVVEESCEDLLAESDELSVEPGYPGDVSEQEIADIYVEAIEEWSRAGLEVGQILNVEDEGEFRLDVYCENDLQFTFEGYNGEVEDYL